jgi:putative modified peptide
MAMKLPEDLAEQLLSKLESDDAFRDLFTESPRKAMASLGFAPASSATDTDRGLWACCKVTELASKEQIKASRSTLRTQLVSGQTALQPIDFQMARSK